MYKRVVDAPLLSALSNPLTATPMRTYTSRKRDTQKLSQEAGPSSDPSSKKRSFGSGKLGQYDPPRKRAKGSLGGREPAEEAKAKQKTLVQLHFCIDQSVIKKCSICGLRYTQGAKEDMALHRTHCNRVQKGLAWSKEEEKEGYGSTISEIDSRATLENKKIGRIVAFPCDVTGKLGSKVRRAMTIFQARILTKDISLSYSFQHSLRQSTSVYRHLCWSKQPF